MKEPFHYVVKARLIRFIQDGKIDFLEINELFEDENPINARINAFDFYQNYIDVLLQGIGLTYINDKVTREKLISFIDPGTKYIFKIGAHEIEMSDSIGNGIGVYLVINTPLQDPIMDYKDGDEFLLHGIGNMGGTDSQLIMDSLTVEYEYYEHYSLDTQNLKTTVAHFDHEANELFHNEILSTPFDWTGHDLPNFDTVETENIRNIPSENRDIFSKTYEQLIEGGETNQVEFKPSLLYHFGDDESPSGYKFYVRYIIAKVICSFLNANGGYLFVGISDNKAIQGLDPDFSLAKPKGKDQFDYFNLEVDKIIREYFKTIASNIKGEFLKIDEKFIFVFTVFPSRNRPVFIKNKENKEFYVRLTASCERFTDIEEISNYCIDKWGAK